MKTRLTTILVAALCTAVITFPSMAQEASSSENKLYDKPYVGEMAKHEIEGDELLIDIARNNGLGFIEMRAANPDVDPWLPGKRTEITIPSMHLLPDAPREGIVINLPEMHLFFFPEDGSDPEVFSIGIGREGLATPTGATSIIRKKEGPEWRPTKRMKEEDPDLPDVVPAGPENPLGTHALYLGWPEYRIHGTNKPYGIGRRVSSGCIRLYPEGIVELFDLAKEGIKVTVVDQPLKTAWIDDKLYVEAHPTTSQVDQVEIDGLSSTYKLEEKELQRILKAAGKNTGELDWSMIRKAVRERRGYPVVIARRPASQMDEQEQKENPDNKSEDSDS